MYAFLCKADVFTGAPSVLASPFAAMHGLASPLTGPYNGVAAAGGLAGLGGFTLGAGALGVRVPGSPQPSSVLLVSNLNEEVSDSSFILNPLRELSFLFRYILIINLEKLFPSIRKSEMNFHFCSSLSFFFFFFSFLSSNTKTVDSRYLIERATRWVYGPVLQQVVPFAGLFD